MSASIEGKRAFYLGTSSFISSLQTISMVHLLSAWIYVPMIAAGHASLTPEQKKDVLIRRSVKRTWWTIFGLISTSLVIDAYGPHAREYLKEKAYPSH